MTLFRSIIRPNMINGLRSYDPIFKPTVKELPKHDPVLWNTTTSDVYKEILSTVDHPPRMHSFLIPKYKLHRQWQAEATLDIGYPSYMRFPVQRTMYRVLWYLTWVLFVIESYKTWLVIRNANDGTPAPEFAYYLP